MNKKTEKKEKFIQICFCVTVILIITVIGIITLTNNQTLSKKEGRELTTFPKITFKNLTKDEFYTNYTNAFADQLAFREELIKDIIYLVYKDMLEML